MRPWSWGFLTAAGCPKDGEPRTGRWPRSIACGSCLHTGIGDRTEKNVLDSHGTLIISLGPLTGGSALTEALCIRHDRPCLHLDMELVNMAAGVRAAEQWLARFGISILNIAGPRAGGDARIYTVVRELALRIRWDDHREVRDEGY